MSDQEATEAVGTPAGKPSKSSRTSKKKAAAKPAKAKSEKAKTAKRAKPGKPAKPAKDFDFIGKVESLKVRSGAGAGGFEFGLRGRRSKRKSFRFDPSDAFAMNAMAHLVLAAHASATKIGVRTGDKVDGVFLVRELESRPKLGKG